MIDSVSYGDFEQTQSVKDSASILALEFPYLAIPSEVYAQLNANLTAIGFVCFRAPFEEVTYCQSASSCGSVMSSLSNIDLVTSNYGTITMPPSMYLKDMDNGECKCLVTEADDNNAGDYWAVLGAPFFRNTTIQFNFESHLITIYGKEGNSPISPTSSTTDKLGSGAIAGIAIGSFLFVLLVVLCLMYCCCCRGKSQSKEVHNSSI